MYSSIFLLLDNCIFSQTAFEHLFIDRILRLWGSVVEDLKEHQPELQTMSPVMTPQKYEKKNRLKVFTTMHLKV